MFRLECELMRLQEHNDDAKAAFDKLTKEHEDMLKSCAEMEAKLAELTTKKRKALHPSSFVFPATKRYPIPDISHGRNALARSSGKPEEAKVKAAVYKKYPSLKSGS